MKREIRCINHRLKMIEKIARKINKFDSELSEVLFDSIHEIKGYLKTVRGAK